MSEFSMRSYPAHKFKIFSTDSDYVNWKVYVFKSVPDSPYLDQNDKYLMKVKVLDAI